jgi:hypothetical protein
MAAPRGIVRLRFSALNYAVTESRLTENLGVVAK